MWTISLPLSVPTGKSKTFALNLNVYRNAHHHITNKAKVAFLEMIQPLLMDIPSQVRIKLLYELYAPTAGRRDLMNVTSVTDKFFSDVLPEAGIIKDDCADFIPHVECVFRGIDRQNPRVDVTIIPLTEAPAKVEPTQEEGPPPMGLQLTIGQVAIEAAVRAYYVRHIMEADLSLIAGRGDNGFSSNLALTNDQIEQAISEAVAVQLPGLDLDIKLHATRGAEGFTAVISAPLSLDPDTILAGVVGSTATPQPAPILSAAPTDEPAGVAGEVKDEPAAEAVVEAEVVTESAKPVFRRRKTTVIETTPAPEPESDLEPVMEQDPDEDAPTGEFTADDEDIQPGSQRASTLEEDMDWEGGLPPETPSGLTTSDEEVEQDVVDREPAIEEPKQVVNLFRRPAPAQPQAASSAGPNKLFGKLARPDNSHLNADQE